MTKLTSQQLDDILDRIHIGLCNYTRKHGFNKVLVGCSGGIDSAITIALAAMALGPENVTAITMPSDFSSAGSVTDSRALCENLGVTLLEHPIRFNVAQFCASLDKHLDFEPTGLALENLQARVRGLVLMTYSNAHGHLVLTTGNKSEAMVGYCTLYGDTCGGLNLIGDLYKTEVFELAQFINEQAEKELIPRAIIDKAPSAELAPGQRDEDSLPPYPILDAVLKLMGDNKAEAITAYEELSLALSTDERIDVINQVRELVTKSAFKRLQMAPAIRLRGALGLTTDPQ